MKDVDPYGEEDWLGERKISYQKKLCQDLWSGDVLNEKIKKKLVKISKDFFEDVELETEIINIYLTGSMTNYNYNTYSDIDVHVVIDFKDINEDVDLVKKVVDGQRFIWNLRHNITIKDHDVELYIQDKSEEHRSTGLYSLLNDEWIKKPIYNPPDVDTEDITLKYDARVYDILRFEKLSKQDLYPEESEEYYNSAKELKAKIMKARKEGLSEEGEFSLENLVFKKLRREGKIKKLIDTITRFYDMIYSQ
jgi:predicted nucleotidyltransferase